MTSLIKTRAGSIELGKIHPEDDALELMYFGSREMTHRADEYLATLGLANCVLWTSRTFPAHGLERLFSSFKQSEDDRPVSGFPTPRTAIISQRHRS
jgi:hypothetical protein